jgi:hypothetical protein
LCANEQEKPEGWLALCVAKLRWVEHIAVIEAMSGAVIFCSRSAPRLPDELIETAHDICLRLHGTNRWYRHNYSTEERRIQSAPMRFVTAESR